MAKDQKDNAIKTFGLDRLNDLEFTTRVFKVPIDFNLEDQFRYCFGIVSPNDTEPKEIVLSLDPLQGKYVKTLPLHETQEVIIDTEEELRIKLKLYLLMTLSWNFFRMVKASKYWNLNHWLMKLPQPI